MTLIKEGKKYFIYIYKEKGRKKVQVDRNINK